MIRKELLAVMVFLEVFPFNVVFVLENRNFQLVLELYDAPLSSSCVILRYVLFRPFSLSFFLVLFGFRIVDRFASVVKWDLLC